MQPNAPHTPYYRIILEGEDITSWVKSVTLTEDERQADSISLTLADPRLLYCDAIFEGSEVEIDMGYAAANKHALMLRAIITKVEMRYPQNGIPTLTLKGEDRSIEMGLVEKRRVWKEQSVTDVVRDIGEEYGFSVEARLTSDPLIEDRPIVQDSKTDLAFLQDLARTYHAKCFVELDESGTEVLYFIPERRVLSSRQADSISLSYRSSPSSNLISFSPKFDSSYIDRLKLISDIDQEGNQIESQPALPKEIFLWELNPMRLAQANLRELLKIQALYRTGLARKQRLQEQLTARRETVGEVAPTQAEVENTNDTLDAYQLGMSASGSTFGNIWLRARSIIEIDGVSERFNGEWYVTSATHKIDNRGYTTDFKCVR